MAPRSKMGVSGGVAKTPLTKKKLQVTEHAQNTFFFFLSFISAQESVITTVR